MTDASQTVGPPVPPPVRPRVHRRRFASLRTITALILREMSTTYGRSPGGYLWAVLEPVAGIALMSIAFAAFIRAPQLGTNFPLFYSTGMLPFMLFMSVSGALAQSLNFSRPLLAYPSVTWLDAIIARFVLNVLTELMVAYVIFTGIIAYYDTRVILDLPVIAEGFALTGALALGIGTLNCFLFTRFPVWQRAWSILMRPLVLVSGVIILHETLPQPFRDILWYNPLVHVVGLVRSGFYSNYSPDDISVLYVLGISGGSLLLGLLFLSRYHRDLLSR